MTLEKSVFGSSVVGWGSFGPRHHYNGAGRRWFSLIVLFFSLGGFYSSPRSRNNNCFFLGACGVWGKADYLITGAMKLPWRFSLISSITK